MPKPLYFFLLLALFMGCQEQPQEQLIVEYYQTSAAGDKLKQGQAPVVQNNRVISVYPDSTLQQISGFGGAFTESSAYLLNKMSVEKRQEIIEAYFAEDGANYSLTRTHMNSCDFSIDHYSYAPIAGDTALANFSVKEDADDLIPMIKDAMAASGDGFKIIASPWTAPPWMKDNNHWYAGKLLPEYYSTWANFFVKYTQAYEEEGIDIWGFTVENEPLGNDGHWESMHFTAEEMAAFIKNHLGPTLKSQFPEKKLLVYDQNRGDELKHWANVMLKDQELDPYVDGTAVHWYSSTINWFPESLEYTKNLAPDKLLLHTEGCVDAEIPHWQEDSWYWQKEATDWGFDWAAEENKHNHPKYVPVYRYARDIIGCLNSGVQGWIDWNMVLDRQGGPNLAQNWCVAPVIVDPEQDMVYFTPLYYTMAHFSKYIRPGANIIYIDSPVQELMITGAVNQDGSIAIVMLNMTENSVDLNLDIKGKRIPVLIDKQALQTIHIKLIR